MVRLLQKLSRIQAAINSYREFTPIYMFCSVTLATRNTYISLRGPKVYRRAHEATQTLPTRASEEPFRQSGGLALIDPDPARFSSWVDSIDFSWIPDSAVFTKMD